MAVSPAPEPDRASSAWTGRLALIGVLALQGGFQAHERVLRRLGARVREVRVPADLDGLDGLVIPGGESTTMMLGLSARVWPSHCERSCGRACPCWGPARG